MKILILAGKGESTKAVVNALSDRYKDILIVIENKPPKTEFIKRRIRRLGLFTVIGQIAFSVIIVKCLRRNSQNRISEIISRYGMNYSNDFMSKSYVKMVDSVNDPEVVSLIKDYSPEIIIVNGTRIISKTVLDEISVPIINMHVGITPKYRGVHGGYWAMANNDAENCGVTIHYVNSGVDTGDVIRQKRINVSSSDNFVTYPYIQTGEGIKLELEILDKFEKTGSIDRTKVDLPSKMWSHPTFFQYLKNRKNSR